MHIKHGHGHASTQGCGVFLMPLSLDLKLGPCQGLIGAENPLRDLPKGTGHAFEGYKAYTTVQSILFFCTKCLASWGVFRKTSVTLFFQSGKSPSIFPGEGGYMRAQSHTGALTICQAPVRIAEELFQENMELELPQFFVLSAWAKWPDQCR